MNCYPKIAFYYLVEYKMEYKKWDRKGLFL